MITFGSIKAGDQFFHNGNSYVKIEEQSYEATLFSGDKVDVIWNAVNLSTKQPHNFDDFEEITIFKCIEDFCDNKSTYTYPEEPREIDINAEPEVEEAFDNFIHRYTEVITEHFSSKLGCSSTELLTMAILRRLE